MRLALLFLALNAIAPIGGPLRVLRVTPTSPATPSSVVTVTFDRPVAGGLDAPVDARSIFTIEPAIAGEVEWRDPVTLRFTPAEPLTPGSSYRIRISPNFHAMDGTRLAGPYEATFRVASPRVLGGEPANQHREARHLPATPTFQVLVSSPVTAEVVERLTSIRLDPGCTAPGEGGATIPVQVRSIRELDEADPPYFTYLGYMGPYPRDPSRDLRRVVELEPASPLPLDCSGRLVFPSEFDPAPTSPDTIAWRFRTYSPLSVVGASCGYGQSCPTGPVRLEFSAPVRGSEILRRVRIAPDHPFTVDDTTAERAIWVLDARLAPRERYAVVVDGELTDIFGQRLGSQAVAIVTTTGYAPHVSHEFGRLLVEREGLGTLAVQHVNVDTLEVTIAPVPDTLIHAFLGRSWGWDEPWRALVASGAAERRLIPVPHGEDERLITGVPILKPGVDDGGAVARGATGTLFALTVSSPRLDSISRRHRPIALVQVTDLALHARVGTDQAIAWVTGVHDGLPRPGAVVTLYDAERRVRATARTDHEGIARFDRIETYPGGCTDWSCVDFEGYVVAELRGDRAVVGINAYDPDLSPWRFNVSGAWGAQREPVAAAVFTERGIYRPGEVVHAKAIVREGPLGALRAPAPGDSLRWLFHDREGAILRERTAPLSEFGTADQRLELPAELPLGQYSVEVQMRSMVASTTEGAGSASGDWRTLAATHYQVAEYRPPEFLVDVETDLAPRLAGDTVDAHIAARYLFGAPMAHAPVNWSVRQQPLHPWELEIPGAEGFQIGKGYSWWDDDGAFAGPRVIATVLDTLDDGGSLDLRVPLPDPVSGRAARVGVLANVTDANRQMVAGGASLIIHPAEIYVGARVRGSDYFWTAGEPVTVEVIAVRAGGVVEGDDAPEAADPAGAPDRPEANRVPGVEVRGALVRREWHRVRRERGGRIQEIGSWVQDTVATCVVTTGTEPVPCNFSPPLGGSYTLTLTATDPAGRTATTTLSRWAAGPGWVPWNDETQIKLDLIPDRERYAVGDTATVLFASPFTDAEAWVTVERERVIESRRIRIADGATTLKFPITEAYAPNAFVSVVVVRGRSAPPGPLDDPGRPTLRVGYAELRVTPEVKRLSVEVTPQQVEYRPGDTAGIRVRVDNATGRPERAEVTLWAVDEGVLALTGYRTPDPIDLLYPPRGVSLRLASNLTAVAAQIPEGQKGKREAGGGGGEDLTAILRSRFQTTAFFLGSLVTDENGEVVARAKLPDNLTTFRVMAVAVTAGDRYGSGQSDLLVSRPLVARPALPRFVREGDEFSAGAVINSRLGGSPRVKVEAKAEGARIRGRSTRTERVSGGSGLDVRFDFNVPVTGPANATVDSARFQFRASSGREADAVAVAVPIRESRAPLVQTIAGTVHDTATATFVLQDDVDPSRSTLEIDFGASPLAFLRGASRSLRVYPYICTEQITSIALPLIALYRAGQEFGDPELAGPNAAAEIEATVATITRRRRPDGGIGFWSVADWSSPWLTAYAGRVLLEARAAGFVAPDTVLAGIATYLGRSLREPLRPEGGVTRWLGSLEQELAERLAAAEFLSRYGEPDIAAENRLLQQAARLRWEDRVLLAELLARRGERAEARRLLEHASAAVLIEGRVAVLPDSARGGHYFASSVRPAARLLSALLEIEPTSPLIGPLVERIAGASAARDAAGAPLPGAGGVLGHWNTQDLGAAALALARYEEFRREAGSARVRVGVGQRTLVDAEVGAPGGSASSRALTVPLSRLVTRDESGRQVVRVNLAAEGGAPSFYYLTLRETPRGVQLTPVDRGIQVERWYEDPVTGQPIVSAREGELVRVRLRVTVPAERSFVVLDDPLPAGLEVVDLSLRTVSPFSGGEAEFLAGAGYGAAGEGDGGRAAWSYGRWDAGLWSPFDHKELRDDRVIYPATVLWPGTHSATYLARATTAGTYLYPPARAEEMYNPGVNGRTGGGVFRVER